MMTTMFTVTLIREAMAVLILLSSYWFYMNMDGHNGDGPVYLGERSGFNRVCAA